MIPSILTPASHATAFVAEQMNLQQDEMGSLVDLNPFSFLPTDSTDSLHYGQMHNDPDRSKFEASMQDEVDGLFANDTLDVVPALTMPPVTKPLSAIRSFCHKRLPCWTILK